MDQASKFDQDPSGPPPSVEDDRREPRRRRASTVGQVGRVSAAAVWAVVLLCTALTVGGHPGRRRGVHRVPPLQAQHAGRTWRSPTRIWICSGLRYAAVRGHRLPAGAASWALAVNNYLQADNFFSPMDLLVMGFRGEAVSGCLMLQTSAGREMLYTRKCASSIWAGNESKAQDEETEPYGVWAGMDPGEPSTACGKKSTLPLLTFTKVCFSSLKSKTR